MTYIVDIFLIIVFVLTVIVSAKKGFFLSLFDLFRTLISLFIARILSVGVAPVLYDSFVEKGALSYLTKSLGNVGTTDYVTQVEQALNSIPESLNGILSMLGFDKTALTDKIAAADLGGDNLIETIMNNLVEPVSTALIQFVVFAVSVIVIGLILKIVIKLLDRAIKKLPKLKSFNTMFGALFGVVRGGILVVIFSMLIISVASLINNENLIQYTSESVILNTIQGLITAVSGFNA